jgi:hypothetical protein
MSNRKSVLEFVFAKSHAQLLAQAHQHFGSFETDPLGATVTALISWLRAGLTQITTKESKPSRVFQVFCGSGLDPARQTGQSEAA